MKQYTFKNFNYEVANSARKGVKEVRVTFTADGQSVRHYLFIKEIKGKGNAFYVKKAKGIVASRIKSGELAKTANRQIKGFKLSSGALKPVLITLAAVVGVGAVGTGGYFLSQYLGHNPTPTPVETGYTVVLSGGDEGYFGTSESVNYVVLEDVKEGTKLNEITGYAEPVSKLYKDFTSWVVTGSDDVKFGKNEAITASTYLTAVFTDNVQSIREQAKKDILSVYNSIAISLGSDEDSKDILANMDAMLLAANSSTSPLVASDNKEVIKNIGDLTQKALFAVAFAEQPYRQTITQSYTSRLKEINSVEPEKANALALISSGYLEALFKVEDPTNPGCLDRLFEFLNIVLKEEPDEETIKIYSILAPGALETASLISTEDMSSYGMLLGSLDENVGIILDKTNVHPEDLDTLSDLSNKLFKAFSAAIRKTTDPKTLPEAIKIVDSLHKEALGRYDSIYEHDPTESTFYHKTLFDLSKLALEKLEDAEAKRFTDMPAAFKEAINKFDYFSEQSDLVSSETTQVVEKLTILKNICEGEIKALSRLFDDKGTLSQGVIDPLYSGICNPDLPFNANVISFAYSVLDTAANMPDRESSQILQSGAGYEALAAVAGELGDILSNIIANNYPQESLQCFNVLSAAVLGSTKDCRLDKLFKGAGLLASNYRSLLEIIYSGEPITTDIKNDCIIIGNMIAKFCAFLGKYCDFNPSSFDKVFNDYIKVFLKIKEKFGVYYNDAKTLFAQELDKGLSNVILNCEFCADDSKHYISEISKVFSGIPNELMRMPYEIWANKLKMLTLLHQSSEMFAPIIYSGGKEDFSLVAKRYDIISKSYPYGFESLDKFDEVYNAWKTGLFNKVVRTITEENFVKLMEETSAVVKAIIEKA